jgi:hypothetical protein
MAANNLRANRNAQSPPHSLHVRVHTLYTRFHWLYAPPATHQIGHKLAHGGIILPPSPIFCLLHYIVQVVVSYLVCLLQLPLLSECARRINRAKSDLVGVQALCNSLSAN